MKSELEKLLISSEEKVRSSMRLLNSSLEGLEPFDDTKEYSDKELEPYDALSGRFIRAVETILKFFRTYEKYQFAEQSDTIRDMLNKMEKLGIISSTEIWLEMRDLRNRIVHDYLPSELKKLYDLIMNEYKQEMKKVLEKIEEPKIN